MKVDLSTLVSGVILGASVLIYAPAQAQGANADTYDYALRQSTFSTYTDGANGVNRPDPFSDGAHGVKQADVYTDGANVQGKRSQFSDGAHSNVAHTIAGMDHTGVSAPPARSNLTDDYSAA